MKVLIVEDTDIVAEVFKRYFEKVWEADCIIAESNEEAMAAYDPANLDIITFDYTIVGGNTEKFLRHVLATGFTGLILICTEDPDGRDKLMVIGKGRVTPASKSPMDWIQTIIIEPK